MRTSTCALRCDNGLLIHSGMNLERVLQVGGGGSLTPRERANPCLEILGHLGHLNVGVKLVNLIQDSILVIVAKVIRGLLLGCAH